MEDFQDEQDESNNNMKERAKNDEFVEEDGEDGPLIAQDQVQARLKLWEKTLYRPPRGNIKVSKSL